MKKKSDEIRLLEQEEAALSAQKKLTEALLRKIRTNREENPVSRARTQTDAEIKKLNDKLIDLHKRLRICHSRLHADKMRTKQRLFVFNVLFVPLLTVVFALVRFLRLFGEKKP